MNWLTVMPYDELAINARKAVEVDGEPVLLINSNGEVFAIHNQCSHQELPLDGGEIEGDVITCPFHGAQFCFKTGAVLAPPAFSGIVCYPVRIEQGMIEIQI